MLRRVLVLFLLGQLAPIESAVSGTETVGPLGVRDPALSPDGRYLAMSLGGVLRVVDLEAKKSWVLPSRDGSKGAQEAPSWSEDSQRVVFSELVDGRFRLFEASRDGKAVRELETDPDANAREPRMAERSLLYVRESFDGLRSDLVVEEDGTTRVLAAHDSRNSMPAISPRGSLGRRVAFVSDRTGDPELWVVPLDGGDAVRLTFEDGEDLYPAWSSGGSRIAYSTERRGERYLAVIDASGGEPSVFHRGGGQAVWLPGDEELLLATASTLPPVYNGNPDHDAGWPEVFSFGAEGAFDLVRLEAPRPLDASVRASLPQLETRTERNLRLYESAVAANEKLYRGNDEALARFREQVQEHDRGARAAKSDAEVEAVIDELIEVRPLLKAEGRSSRAVVASAHPLATETGLSILHAGGNVVDAAIAVSFMLGVVEPDASGIGGEGMMLLHRQDLGETVAIDFKDQVPMHATRENPAIFDGSRLKSHGPAAVNIPGTVAGMGLAYEKFGSGKIPWKELVAPAIRAASEGVIVTRGLASSLKVGEPLLRKYPAAAKIYLPEGRPLREGDLLKNLDYANTLRAIADEGAEAFYRGDIADGIARDMQTNGGILTKDDLSQYRAIAREPLVGHYRNLEIAAAPPPVSAGATLLQMLQILDNHPVDRSAHYRRSTNALHYMIEAWKSTSGERLIADPAMWEVDLTEVLSKEWARARFDAIDPQRASTGPDLPEDPDARERYRRERISTGTTAAVVADTEGNLVALTQTLSTWGGAFYVSEGLGFLYNNHLRLFGAPRGAKGSLTPLARTSTGICPTLVFRIGDHGERVPYIALGAAGNAWITASVYEVLTSIVDFGLGPQEAIEAPRFLVQSKRFPLDRPPVPTQVWYEQGIRGTVVAELRSRGHELRPMGVKGEPVMGYAAVAVVDVDERLARAGADPRRAHAASGLK